MDTCPRRGKFFGGCKFEPIYNTTPPDAANVAVHGSRSAVMEFIEKTTKHEFVGMACIRCGRKEV